MIEPSVCSGDAALCQTTLTTCYYFYTLSSKDPQSQKQKIKTRLLDGYKSGMLTVRVLCKSMELKCCIAVEMCWNKYYELSLASSD